MRPMMLILMILALGCTTVFRPGSELPAVVIKEYNFDQDTIRQGQVTGVNLVLQNLGSEKARNIKTKLFRVGEGITVTSPFNNVPQTQPVLNPPDESTQTPGESKEFAWTIRANTIDTDTKTTKSYNIGVIVGYDYKSEGFSDLLATTKEQAKIDKNQLPSLRSGSTKGPITVTVITPNTILYGKDEKITVRVDVVNGANGIVYAGRSGADGVVGTADEMNKIKSIELSLPKKYIKHDTESLNSIWTSSGDNTWCCKPNCGKDVPTDEKTDYMWTLDAGKPGDPDIKLRKEYGHLVTGYGDSLALLRGRQKSYVCYFLVDKSSIPEQQVIPIRATAEYSYSTEDSKILVVEGAK